MNENKTEYSKVQKFTLLVAILTSFQSSFIGSAINLSIPDISAEFAVSAVAIGWIVTAYMLPVAALSVPFGRISDIIGKKQIILLGLAIFTFGNITSIVVNSFALLVISRIIQAIGAAMIFATNHAILVSEFPGRMRGKVLGYALAATYTGLSAGPVLGGIFNHYLGWRYIFLFTAILGVISLVLAAKMLPKRESELAGEKFDMAGNVMYVMMILLIIYGLNACSENPATLILVPIGVIFGVLFVRRQLRVDSPVVNVRLFANNISYTLSNLAALLNYAATYAISYLLSIYLQVAAGFPSQTAGIILLAQPIVMAVLSPYMGRLSDRISPFKMASFGMALIALCLFVLSFVGVNTPVWFIIVILCITGFGFAAFSSPNTNAVMSSVSKEFYGVASSLLATMRNIGHVTSMVIVTIIVSLNLGDVALADASPSELVHTMKVAYLVFTVICIFGVFCSAKRKTK